MIHFRMYMVYKQDESQNILEYYLNSEITICIPQKYEIIKVKYESECRLLSLSERNQLDDAIIE